MTRPSTLWTAVSSWVCEQCSTCDFKRLFQSEGARIQRFAENRGIHAQIGKFLDGAQVIELGNATGRGDLRISAFRNLTQQIDVRTAA